MDSPNSPQLHVRAWPDPVIDQIGFEPQSAYFEWCWLPRLGPSACWAYRRLTSGLLGRPDGYDIEVGELAHWLGLGSGTGRNAPVRRAIGRLVVFGLGTWQAEDTLAVRRRVPPLSLSQVSRLRPSVQAAHRRLLAAQPRVNHPSQAAS